MIRSILLIGISILFLTSCEKKDEVNDSNITKSEITGVIQKGPFLNGTAVDIYELDIDLSPTGKSFSSQIMDNSGLFQLNDVSLISQYIQVKANGYYFNEVSGENSNSSITLYALSDINDKNSVNVNILSHLEKSRVEYLIQTESMSFIEAKNQAEQEVLNIFSIQKDDISDFEMLDISEDGDDNAILLAISLITQGYRAESELSDLLANINTDLRQDGELNNSTLGSLLINDVRLFNLAEIRENLESRYQNLGLTVTIPDFETYINTFIDSASYEITNRIEYPQISYYQKQNLLYPISQNSMTIYDSYNYSIAANLPRGTSLLVTIEPQNPDALPNLGFFGIRISPDGPINYEYENSGSSVLTTITSIESDTHCDMLVQFFFEGIYILKVFEEGASVPIVIKTIEVI